MWSPPGGSSFICPMGLIYCSLLPCVLAGVGGFQPSPMSSVSVIFARDRGPTPCPFSFLKMLRGQPLLGELYEPDWDLSVGPLMSSGF